MVGKNEPTYAIDAEIRGQFVSIVLFMLLRIKSCLSYS